MLRLFKLIWYFTYLMSVTLVTSGGSLLWRFFVDSCSPPYPVNSPPFPPMYGTMLIWIRCPPFHLVQSWSWFFFHVGNKGPPQAPPKLAFMSPSPHYYSTLPPPQAHTTPLPQSLILPQCILITQDSPRVTSRRSNPLKQSPSPVPTIKWEPPPLQLVYPVLSQTTLWM